MPLLIYFFFGLGWPWVGEFVGFIICFFPTQQNLVNRKHRSITVPDVFAFHMARYDASPLKGWGLRQS